MSVDRTERRVAWLLTMVGAAGLASSGCQATGKGMAALRPLDQTESIDGVMGPTERRLQSVAWEQRREQLKNSGLQIDGLEEFDQAQKFYDAREYRAAENAFKSLAKQRSLAGKSFQDRFKELLARDKTPANGSFGSYGDPIEEDALFMVAESQFAQEKYSWAQDSYGALLEKYPSTRHLDNVTRRLFFIGQTWLGVPPASAKANDVQLVGSSEGGHPEPAIENVDGPSSWPIVPNLTDRTKPVFDTHGRAMQALESIWRHDATGPLADDALMLQATYYQRKGDYIEAARLYKLVREQYPDSTHFQNAFLLGSHVTLASYEGAEYEGGPLTESRQLKETSRQLFGNLSDEQKQRLDAELKAIHTAEAERAWANVEFYLQKQQPASVALYCNRLLHKYPDSPYAKRAWETLESIRPKLTPDEVRLFIGSAPASGSTAPSEPESSGRATLNSSEPPVLESIERPEEWWKTPQPTEEAPDLKPIEPEGQSDSADPPARITL
jgi:outer membrane protein assembly factor BamD (BamD/ComL family)